MSEESVVGREAALPVIFCSQSLLSADPALASVDRASPRVTPSFLSRQAEQTPGKVTTCEVKLDKLVLQADSSRLDHFDVEAKSGGLL